jgi:hypothetical protein
VHTLDKAKLDNRVINTTNSTYVTIINPDPEKLFRNQSVQKLGTNHIIVHYLAELVDGHLVLVVKVAEARLVQVQLLRVRVLGLLSAQLHRHRILRQGSF